MAQLAFLADVHVKPGYVSAVRSSGFRMVWVDDEAYDPAIEDEPLLAWGRRDGLVVVMNDSDFVELADANPHAGVIMYQQYGHSPRAFVRGLSRIDRHLTPDAFRNHVEWLENRL